MRTGIRRMLVFAIGMSTLVWLALVAQPASASGGGGCGRPITEASGKVIRIKDFCFRPTVLQARVGDTIIWVNRDSFEHNVLGANGSWGGYEPMEKGEMASYRFEQAGVYPYACTLHPGMVGSVAVGESAAVSGTAKIDGGSVVPVSSGTLSVATVAYQRRAGGQPQRSVPSGWQVATWSLAVLLVAAVTALMLTWKRRRQPTNPDAGPKP